MSARSLPDRLSWWPYPDWMPYWLRRLNFRFFPGLWTQAEVDDIRARAAKLKAEMDRLTD